MTWRALLLILLALPAAASAKTAEEIAGEMLRAQPQAQALLPAGTCPPPPDLGRQGRALCAAALDAATEAMRYNAEVHRYNANMYRRHQFWTEAAAVAVYLLTASGLVFAELQFFGYGRAGATQSDLELMGVGKISSPVIGLVILVISLGFFYLYVKEVYTIKPADATVAGPA